MTTEVITRNVTAGSAFEAVTLMREVPGVVSVRSARDNGDGTFALTFDFVMVSA